MLVSNLEKCLVPNPYFLKIVLNEQDFRMCILDFEPSTNYGYDNPILSDRK